MKKLAIFTITFFLFSGMAYADLIDGLVAYYPFNGNALDETWNGYDAEVNGAVLTEDRFGNSSSAYSFAAAGAYMKIDTNDFKIQPFSIAVWAKATFTDLNTYIIGYEDGGGYYGWLLRTGDQVGFVGTARFQLQENGPFLIINSDTVISDDSWHFIVVTDDSTTLKIYVDGGEFENSLSSQTALWASTMYCYLGAGRPENLGAGNWFNGSIDDIRIYNRALSQVEVQALYEETPVLDCDFSANPLSGLAPLTVDFTDESTGTVTSWSWDFGDGGTSTEENPTYTYDTPDIYSVSLTVTGLMGPYTETKEDYITVSSSPAALSGCIKLGDTGLAAQVILNQKGKRNKQTTTTDPLSGCFEFETIVEDKPGTLTIKW